MAAAHEGETLAFDEGLRNGLAIQVDELWFVIEEFQLARPAGHEKENHVFGARRKMRQFWRKWIDELWPVSGKDSMIAQE